MMIRCMVPLVLGDGWLVCSLQSTTIKRLLVRSIQPSHPGVLASILQYFVQAEMPRGST